ncbi:hypothetical protein B0T21DRAFT_253870, partial [Apiosordaria backusii]
GATFWDKEGTYITKDIADHYGIPHSTITFLKRGYKLCNDFPGGRPVLQKSVKLRTCGGQYRPGRLFRVFHHGRHPYASPRDRASPGAGLLARGHSEVFPDGTTYMILFQKHFIW